ncbi:MAG TPA: SOS response-associated peptidase [Labilithrix sp.]|nr:SOS response-associated peptidase [Labilithrix sp.]
MCGRATLTSPAEDIASLFEVDPIDIGAPRFNIAPTQPILTVRARRTPSREDEPDVASTPVDRELAIVRWGLIPWWAKPDEAKKIASKCIQARAETAPRTPAFRDAFRRHRCLVVVDGFFEWKTLPDGRRVPHHVRRSHGQPFGIAGLWDSWRPPAPEEPDAPKPERVESCAVLTTRSGGVVRELHDRMPLVLAAKEWDTWLGGSEKDAARLLAQDEDVLAERAEGLVAVPISTWVNDVRHDDPRCIEPIALPDTPGAQAGQADFDFAKPAAGRAKRARKR